MGKYNFANTRRPEPAKYGTEFSETNRFGPHDAQPAASASAQAQSPQGLAAAGAIGKVGLKSWSRKHLFQFVAALIVLRLVAYTDAGSGGQGLMNPSILLLFALALFTFLVREQ